MPWQLLLIFAFVLVVGLAVGALILRTCCGLFGEEQPSYKRALLMLPLVTIPVLLTFEVIGYGCARAMHESLQIPVGFSFINWLRLPMGIQWEVLGKLPFLKWISVVIPLCFAGIMMVAWLNCNFRIGLGIFVVQWILNFLAIALIGQIGFFALRLFHNTIGVPEDVAAYLTPHVPVPGHTATEKPGEGENSPTGPPQGGRFSRLKTTLTGATAVAGHDASAVQPDLSKGTPDGAETGAPGASPDPQAVHQFLTHEDLQSWGHSLTESLDHLRHGAEPLVESVSKAAEPVTRHLPSGVNQFLDHQGGWLILIGLAFVITVLYLRHIVNRVRKLMKRKGRKASDNWNKELSFALADLGTNLHPSGPIQASVQGIPARLRYVALCAGGKDVEPLNENSLEGVLDQILAGLYDAVSPDEPYVKVWETTYGGTLGFAAMFHHLVVIPGPKDKASKWALVAGTVKFGPTEKVHLGLAFELARPASLRNVTVKDGKWLETIGTIANRESAAHRAT